MKNDFLVAITQLCSERSLSREVVIEAVEQALVSAYKRNFGGGQNITASIDVMTGKVKIFSHKTVVDTVADRRNEIALNDARAYDPMAEVGATIQIETTPDDFGRIAAQTAKQVILQRIREAERESLYNTYAEREGEIVLGTVQSMDPQGIIVNLGKIEALLPRTDQISTEHFRRNQKIRAYVSEVNKTSRGPQVILSRTHRNMLRRLFELEVPEIFNGLVEIKAIAREPGARSKIAVVARQDGIDPVGACVGQRGVRIQAVVNELNNEKIDVVEWSSDQSRFVANALSPARVISVRTGEDNNGDKVANVVVEDKQLSLAIGKEGQNARLAAKLTGWRIDIRSQTQAIEAANKIAEAEAARIAAMTPEDIAAEEAARIAAEQAVLDAVEQARLEKERAKIAAEILAAAPIAKVEETTAVEEPMIATSEPAAVEPELVVEGELEIATAPTETTVEGTAAEAGTETETGTETLEEFGEDEDIENETPEEKLKRKADRRKRQTLVFDESLGKVVAKRKHKPTRVRDWTEETEE